MSEHTGAALIAVERKRQVEAEGYSPEHDDAHGWRPLWQAGMAYVEGYEWPWDAETFKPTNLVRDHVKAGALGVAACEVAERVGVPRIESIPARGLVASCEKWLDSVLAYFPATTTEEFSADKHWLKFDATRNVIGCQCGFSADPEEGGYGDSVIDHIEDVISEQWRRRLLALLATPTQSPLAEVQDDHERRGAL